MKKQRNVEFKIWKWTVQFSNRGIEIYRHNPEAYFLNCPIFDCARYETVK